MVVGHVAPEAAAGGNIAFINENDSITIDAKQLLLQLNISDEELAERKERLASTITALHPVAYKRSLPLTLLALVRVRCSTTTKQRVESFKIKNEDETSGFGLNPRGGVSRGMQWRSDGGRPNAIGCSSG